ncbi:Hypothetical protein, putative [Bodo saltans]|uniref:Uncharacterized protein n=1 Tax=Bodo saltans TaxID=75058 RepID=A0A0S4JS80_BODSA|nr:Hypothetical protein, putative [Bodo saltans]|eukprot:CUG92183.1 Hypothetical protein, putative [Bodo saltans]
MAFSGPWDLDGKGVVYDFDEPSKTLTISSPQQDDIDEESSSSTTPTPPIASLTFAVNEVEQLLSLTPVKDDRGATDATATVYRIVLRTDTKITLRRMLPAGSDSMEEEVLVLVPAGLPDTLRDGEFDGEDDDGNDSGVDMGMDLCVVGKKI